MKYIFSTRSCTPNELREAFAQAMQEITNGSPGIKIHRIEHQTCAIGIGANAHILLTLLLEVEEAKDTSLLKETES